MQTRQKRARREVTAQTRQKQDRQRQLQRRQERTERRTTPSQRCVWYCPTCRHKIAERIKTCENCGFRKDGLNRAPSMRDILRAQRIPMDKRGEVTTDALVDRYHVECLGASDEEEGGADWELRSAFSTHSIALQFAKVLSEAGADPPTVRVVDTKDDKELWHSVARARRQSEEAAR